MTFTTMRMTMHRMRHQIKLKRDEFDVVDDVKEGEMAGKTDVSQYTRRCAILGFAFD